MGGTVVRVRYSTLARAESDDGDEIKVAMGSERQESFATSYSSRHDRVLQTLPSSMLHLSTLCAVRSLASINTKTFLC